jgi:hypothetical protein
MVHHTCRVDPAGPPGERYAVSLEVGTPAGDTEIGRNRPTPEYLNERMRSIAHLTAATCGPGEARTSHRRAKSDEHPTRRAVSTGVPAGPATVVLR